MTKYLIQSPFLAIQILAALAVVTACGYADDPESIEPPQRYSLEINGKSVSLDEEKAIRIKGEFTNPVIKLKVEPYRILAVAGMKFRYPRGFAFKAEVENDEVRTFTVQNSDAEIQVIETKGTLKLDEYCEQLTKLLAASGKVETVNPSFKIKLGEQTYSGRSITMTVADIEMLQEIYEIGMSDGRSRILVFQSQRVRAGRTKAATAALDLLKESFSVTQK